MRIRPCCTHFLTNFKQLNGFGKLKRLSICISLTIFKLRAHFSAISSESEVTLSTRSRFQFEWLSWQWTKQFGFWSYIPDCLTLMKSPWKALWIWTSNREVMSTFVWQTHILVPKKMGVFGRPFLRCRLVLERSAVSKLLWAHFNDQGLKFQMKDWFLT